MGLLVSLLLSLATSVSVGSPTRSAPGHAESFYAHPDACPPAHPRAEARVRSILSSPLLPEMRARLDLGTASAADVQLLTTAEDRDACNALWEAMHANGTDLRPGDKVTFYRSGDTFFVPIAREPRQPLPPGTVRLDGAGGSSLDVYDPEYRLVGRLLA